MAQSLYYIQQVARMTGLSRQVIRKWEERYQFIQPVRSGNGYRLYNQKDVNLLLQVKSLAEQGYSIKQASNLITRRSSALEVDNKTNDPVYEESLNHFVFRLLEQGTQCDEKELLQLLQQSFHQLGLEQFISTVIIPFLNEVGLRWEKGEWSEYQEANSSLIVRDFLIQIRRNYFVPDHSPVVLGACLPHEQHEIPLHVLLLQFMMRGWKTQLIGASPAPGSIEALITKLKPNLVLLSASTTIPFEQNPTLLPSLDSFAEQYSSIDFYIGGEGTRIYLADKRTTSLHAAFSMEEINKLMEAKEIRG